MDTPLFAKTIEISGHDGATLEAYTSQPDTNDSRGGVVVIHHLPGYDRETKEFVRRFADAGYDAICPNLYSREGAGVSPDDAAAAVRARGGVPDEQVMGDVRGAIDYLRALPTNNGKVAVIGHCSGGRQTYLAAATLPIDGAIVCYGGLIVGEAFPQFSSMVPIIDKTPQISCPMLGLFGNEDKFPTPEQVDQIEAALKDAGKDYEFHRYDGAGHAFFGPDRGAYRVEAALDGWQRIWAFLDKTVAG
jgi:carboxymethylenebutenolidase